MKYLKSFDENLFSKDFFGDNFFTSMKSTITGMPTKNEIKYREGQKLALKMANDEINDLVLKNENDTEFEEAMEKIMDGDFTNAVKFSTSKYKLKLEDDRRIDVFQIGSMGVGKDGFEASNGDSIYAYKMIIDGIPIGEKITRGPNNLPAPNGYISYQSYQKIVNKIEEFNKI